MSAVILIGLLMIVVGCIGGFVAAVTMDSGPDWLSGLGLLLTRLIFVGIGLVVLVAGGNALLDVLGITVEVGR